jgi:hypothetical protein
MKYNGVISNAYDNGKMLYEIREMHDVAKLFTGLNFIFDYSDSYTLTYQKEMMRMRCYYGRYDIFPSMKVTINIDHINVYSNGWIHEVPEKMKTYIYKLRSFNEHCKVNKLSKRYKEYNKQIVIADKRKEKEKYDKNQTELFKKFQ